MNDIIIEAAGKTIKEAEKQYIKKDTPVKYWTKEYINERIENIKNLRHQILIRFLWYSGVRITEAVSLRKQDIDLTNYIMMVRWLKNRKYNYRNVPMHVKLRDMLQFYISPMKAEDKIFPFTRQAAWQVVKLHLKGNPHRLRHSFAINWLLQGGDIVTLSKILGHAKINTTMKYLDIIPIHQAKVLNSVSFD